MPAPVQQANGAAGPGEGPAVQRLFWAVCTATSASKNAPLVVGGPPKISAEDTFAGRLTVTKVAASLVVSDEVVPETLGGESEASIIGPLAFGAG